MPGVPNSSRPPGWMVAYVTTSISSGEPTQNSSLLQGPLAEQNSKRLIGPTENHVFAQGFSRWTASSHRPSPRSKHHSGSVYRVCLNGDSLATRSQLPRATRGDSRRFAATRPFQEATTPYFSQGNHLLRHRYQLRGQGLFKILKPLCAPAAGACAQAR